MSRQPPKMSDRGGDEPAARVVAWVTVPVAWVTKKCVHPCGSVRGMGKQKLHASLPN